jgi:beta-glucanase (GH16 family)
MNFKMHFAIIIAVLTEGSLHAQAIDAFKPDFNPAPSLAGYKLVWNDEFNKNGGPDTANWRFEKGFVRNRELQWYQNDNAMVKNGVLVIEGRREKIKNTKYDSASTDWRLGRPFAEYTSASMQTKGNQQWQYGRFEIRARIDTAKGAWPAIWTLGVKGAWPRNGEVDIMEFYRIKNEPSILANLAWGTSQPYTAKWHTETKPLSYFTNTDPGWVKKFHIWRMDWTKDSINLYLDDELLNATAIDTTINADGSNPFLQPQFLLLNLALGGNGGDPAAAKTPIKYEVDYVRVYQKKL